MIEIKYPNDVVALQAYTVAELIAELRKFPQGLPVVFAWEGQQIGFSEGRIEVSELIECPGAQTLSLYAEVF